MAQVGDGNRNGKLFGNRLNRFAVAVGKAGTQRVMTPDNFVNGSLQHLNVQGASHA